MRRALAYFILVLIVAGGFVFLGRNGTPVSERRQTPVAPFPYAVREVTVTAADGVALAGALTVPNDAGLRPAVLLLSVAGPNDRDQTFAGHKSFAVIADRLARAGVVSLRLDDRGVGGSLGDYFAASWADLADDAATALRFLKEQPGVDPARAGLAGMSEGGAIAAFASQREQAAFVMLLSAPGLPGVEALRLQFEKTLAVARVDGARAEKHRTAFDDFIRIVTRDPGAPETKRDLVAFLEGPGKALLPPYGFMPKTAAAQADLLLGPWYQSQLRFDPEAAYAPLSAPVLALGGALDPVAPPAEHLAAIERILESGDASVIRIKTIKRANHLLQPAKSGLPAEYARTEETISEEALDEIVRFARRPAGG